MKNKDSKDKYQTLVVQGTEYKTLFTRKYENRKKWVKPNEKEIISFIPGTIKKIFVKKGQNVKKDEPILILTAMKMDNTIYAPFDCTISEMTVNVGDILPKGHKMVILEN